MQKQWADYQISKSFCKATMMAKNFLPISSANFSSLSYAQVYLKVVPILLLDWEILAFTKRKAFEAVTRLWEGNQNKTWALKILAHRFQPHTEPFEECFLNNMRDHHLVLQPEQQVRM